MSVGEGSAADWLTLVAVRGIGPRRLAGWRAEGRSLPDVLDEVEAERLAAARTRAAAWRARGAADGQRLLLAGDVAYPDRLGRLEDPPAALWHDGRLALLSAPTVAIVGTRRASPAGREVAWLLAERAAARGACVVSGLAAGIDAAAHEGALVAGGDTIAVTGTGLDVPYPPAHAPLLAEIRARGLALSEAPPGAGASVGVFPRRNRIIAALADLVVVVEAGHRSGALNTAQHAVACDVLLAAVPGSITERQTAGSNALLRDGAHVIAGLEDLDVLLALATARRGLGVPVEAAAAGPEAPPALSSVRAPRRRGAVAPRRQAEPVPVLGEAAQSLLTVVRHAPASLETAVRGSGLATAVALAAVSELELAGLVQVGLDGVLRTAAAARRA
jgi:DNA processing protein